MTTLFNRTTNKFKVCYTKKDLYDFYKHIATEGYDDTDFPKFSDYGEEELLQAIKDWGYTLYSRDVFRKETKKCKKKKSN